MQYKENDGVFVYNKDIRNKLLTLKGDKKYFKYEGSFINPVGVIGEIVNRKVNSLTNYKGIDEFTRDKETDYGAEMILKYYNGLPEILSFETSGFSNDDTVRWKGKRDEYIGLKVSKEGKLETDLGSEVFILHNGYTGSETDEKQTLGRSIYNNLSTFYKNSDYYISHKRSTDGKSIILSSASFDGFYDGVNNMTSYRNIIGNRVYNVWGEGDVVSETPYARNSETNEFGVYTHKISGDNHLLKKTSDLYNNHKIKTIFSRFHTSDDEGYNDYDESFDSAKIKGIGNPHGRGLLKLGTNSVDAAFMHKTNGYDNPYCRSWTYHHQFSKVRDLMRPLPTSDDNRDGYNINIKYRSRFSGSTESGDEYLRKGTVLQKNGFVRITPSVSDVIGQLSKDGKDYNFKDESSYKTYMNLKKYMFSIENLAWADGTSNNRRNLSMEQLGPNNGRIMWFPPYNLDFKENVQVKWNPHEFIGRGENIYTYSNTTRKGTLTFSILIDHPSIVNSVSDGKYGGAEPDLDPDMDLLRFFAGCQLVDPDKGIPKKLDNYVEPPKKEETVINTEPPKEEPVTNTEPEENVPSEEPIKVPEPENNEIIFYVFFPNNYSGMWHSGINLYGIKGPCTEFPKEYYENLPIDVWDDYLLVGKSAESNTLIFPNDSWLGYEMVKGKGISTMGTEKIPANKTAGAEQADFFTYMDVNKKLHSEKYQYEYRVDYDLRQGGLRGKDSYRDINSFGLNSDLAVLIKEDNTKDATYTFSEVFTVLNEAMIYKSVEDGKKEGVFKYMSPEEYLKSELEDFSKFKTYVSTLSSNPEESMKRMEKLESILIPRENTKTEFSSVIVRGCATDQDKKNSNTLAKRRAYSVKSKLDYVLNCGTKVGDIICFSGLEKSTNNNCKEAKLARCAKVVMNLKTTTIEKVGTDKENIATVTDEQAKTLPVTPEETTSGTTSGNTSGNTSNDSGNTKPNEVKENKVVRFGKNNSNAVYKTISTIDEDELTSNNSANSRYDDEYRFFRRLKEDSPLIYKKLTDKFKYFNPAFHSLSPEGFNARLTFLHQCTRQGHTMSASENSNDVYHATAGNLSFGKMPVCVLRIGDFINTKIMIETMTIDYKNGDSMQWDLNQEGAGVQPMFANITLGIYILGGQSLEGPINRLQNAVTFNYYANAPVYDDRADRIRNNYDGTITYEHLYTPFND